MNGAQKLKKTPYEDHTVHGRNNFFILQEPNDLKIKVTMSVHNNISISRFMYLVNTNLLSHSVNCLWKNFLAFLIKFFFESFLNFLSDLL